MWMFYEGKQSIEVSIDLDISEETIKFCKEYLKLTGHHKLLKIEDKLKDKFEKFFDLYEEVEPKYCLEEFMKALEKVREIDMLNIELLSLEEDKELCQKEVNDLILKKQKLLQEIN